MLPIIFIVYSPYYNRRGGGMLMMAMPASADGGIMKSAVAFSAPSAPQPQITVRKEFPETWIWDSIDNIDGLVLLDVY